MEAENDHVEKSVSWQESSGPDWSKWEYQGNLFAACLLQIGEKHHADLREEREEQSRNRDWKRDDGEYLDTPIEVDEKANRSKDQRACNIGKHKLDANLNAVDG